MKMKKLGNKGFTLLEMVVAFSILAVVMLTVTYIITTSANTYSKVSADINLQFESQTAMSQLHEYVIDCNAYIAVSSDGSELFLFNKTGITHYDAYKFAKQSGTDALYLYKKPIDTNDLQAESAKFTFDDTQGQLMSSCVESFTAEASTTSVSITLDYNTHGRTYSGQQIIALRNPVKGFERKEN